MVEALSHCKLLATARTQLYRWIVFNVLIGNGDNHIENLSFLVGAGGVALAPTYDLLSTAAYDTRAMADERGRWPATSLALHLGDARSFSMVTRRHLLDAGRQLGLRSAQALRELDKMLSLLPLEADRLMASIDAQLMQDLQTSPDRRITELHLGGERRLLRTIRHIVIAEMVKQLA